MSSSDARVFLESLKMWDHPEEVARGPAVLRADDNVDRLVDEMFERFCLLELDRPHSFVGNC